MKLTLSPTRGLPGQAETEITVSGDTITMDGVPYNLSVVPEGGEATPQGEHPFVGAITREGGKLHATVNVVLGDDAASVQPSDPTHWVIDVDNGPVSIPAMRKPQPAEEETA